MIHSTIYLRMRFFGKGSGRELGLVIDIGSASVGAALVLLDGEGAPQIISSTRHPITVSVNDNQSSFFHAMLSSLSEVLRGVVEYGLSTKSAREIGSRPSHILCSLTSPWYRAQTRVVRYTQPEYFTVTPELLRSLLVQEVKRFQESALKEERRGASNSEGYIIDSTTISMKLNGYQTAEPFDRKTKSVEATAFLSLASQEVIQGVEHAISKYFHTENLRIHSFPLIAFTLVRDLFINVDDFLILDVSGEVIDLSVVRGGILEKTVSTPLGRNSIIRGVAEAFHMDPEHALSLLRLYGSGSAERSVIGRIEKILEKEVASFNTFFGSFITDIKNRHVGSVPRAVFATLDEELLRWLLAYFKKNRIDKVVFGDLTFNVYLLGEQLFASYLGFTKGVRRDPFIMIETLFLNNRLR